LIGAIWWWLSQPVALAHAPVDPAAKLDCVSYAPFRNHQTPFRSDLIIGADQIAQDLEALAKVSRCVRTYSVDNGLDKVPELAAQAGLKVILGIWLGRDRAKNAELVDRALAKVEQYPDVISAIMVGSEVLLRGEMTAGDLRAILRTVKARTATPISYADVWEFWLRYREVAADVDFVTIHILPYWEDSPVRAEDAARHVDDIRQEVAVAFPGKEILIGETGWPSRGRMRDGALPSRISQARFMSEILDRARRENFRVNVFEAYDEPWKRQWEGTVGGYWGLFDGWHRGLKYPADIAVNEHPFWKMQLAAGLAFGGSIFAIAWLAARRRSPPPSLAAWIAVATSATLGGALVGLSAEDMFYQSYGIDGWLVQGTLVALSIVVPLLCSHALMAGRAVPAITELIGPREGRSRSRADWMLGLALIATALVAVETALGLVFDSRWRDFPFAGLALAVLPFCTLRLLNRGKSHAPRMAESVFAGLLMLAALYVLFNEGFRNWQSMWTAAAYGLLGLTLWRARLVSVAGRASAQDSATEAFILAVSGSRDALALKQEAAESSI
jgi:exo-beta-1,3-glucanase (GH17 family)